MAKRGNFGAMPGNMNNLMKQAQRMQRQMEEKQAELAEKEWEAQAGGGVVKVKVNSEYQLTDVTIAPEAVDPDDVEMLQDLVMAAVNEALKAMEEEKNEVMNSLAGGLGGGLGGFPF